MGVYDHRNRRANQNASGQGTLLPVPEEVLPALAHTMINHRGREFAAILRRVTARMQYVYQTASPMLIFPTSGTAGMECALPDQSFSPGEHTVAVVRDRFHAKNSREGMTSYEPINRPCTIF